MDSLLIHVLAVESLNILVTFWVDPSTINKQANTPYIFGIKYFYSLLHS